MSKMRSVASRVQYTQGSTSTGQGRSDVMALTDAFKIIKEGGQPITQNLLGGETTPFETMPTKPEDSPEQKRLKAKEKQDKYAQGPAHDLAHDRNLLDLMEEFQPSADETADWVRNLRHRLGPAGSHRDGHKEIDKKAEAIANAIHEFQVLGGSPDPSVGHTPNSPFSQGALPDDAEAY